MNCAFDKEKLTGFYDGELGAAEKAEVERHIASCSECLRDLGELKSAAVLVKDLPRLRAPKSIAEGVSREIQAAGKVNVLAKFRRTVLWASAAAAGLFVAMNVMYFSTVSKNAPTASLAPMPSPVAPLAKVDPGSRAASEAPPATVAPAPEAPPVATLRQEADRNLSEQKNLEKRDELKEVPTKSAALKKSEAPAEQAEKRGAAESKPSAALPARAAPAATPEPPKAPGAPMPIAPKLEAAKPTVADKEKDAAKGDPQFAPKVDPSAQARSGAFEVPAELTPIHCTLSSTQLSKTRPRMEETLKKMGVPLPAPPPVIKGPRREIENTITIEITDSQLATLREELESPGDARLVQSNPVEPVLPQFRVGGLYAGAKRESATGGAPSGGRAKPAAKESKEAEEAAAVPEPKRKVTLHLVEVKTLPADADDRTPKK